MRNFFLSLFVSSQEISSAFFTPEPLRHTSFKRQLKELEEFWDFESLRVGETGAKGWAVSLLEGLETCDIIPQDAGNKPSLQLTPQRDLFTTWMVGETVMESQIPRRVTDSDEDLDSTVTFDDIRDMLINLKGPRSRLLLKRIWLSLLGLHIPGLSAALLSRSGPFEHAQDYWSRSNLRRHAIMGELLPIAGGPRSPESGASDGIGALMQNGLAFGPVKEWGYGLCDPLSGATEDGRYRMWEDLDTRGVDIPFVRAVFQQLRQKEDPEWDRLSLAFEAAVDMSGWVVLGLFAFKPR